MAVLSFLCPTKGYRVSTGIDLPAGQRITPGQFHAYAYCPCCGTDHEWTAQHIQFENDPIQQFGGSTAAAA
jgi:hypothetical protein